MVSLFFKSFYLFFKIFPIYNLGAQDTYLAQYISNNGFEFGFSGTKTIQNGETESDGFTGRSPKTW